MSIGLSKPQARTLAFIKSFMAKNGFPPSYREIAAAAGRKSTSSTFGTVQQLIGRGYLRQYKREGEKSCMTRSLELVDPDGGDLRSEVVLADATVPSDAHHTLDRLLDLVGASPCQITITIREMPFAPTKEA